MVRVVADGPVLGDLALDQAEACACSTSKVRPVGSMSAKPMKSNPAWKVPVRYAGDRAFGAS